MDDVTTLSNHELADGICTWAGRIAAGEAHLLTLIGEFDRREAWGGPGMLSCAHWLSWRIGMGLVATRERVRAAKALRELPGLQGALAAGRLSWTQARAITRVARPDDGIDWLIIAKYASGAQLEAICRGVRRVQRAVEDEADPELAEQRMRTTKRYDQDGTLVITVRVSAEDGAVVLAGLDAVKADLDHQSAARSAAAAASASLAAVDDEGTPAPPSTPVTAGEPWPGQGRRVGPDDSAESSVGARASDANALVELARRALEHQRSQHPDIARRARSALTPQVDPLSGWARLCDGELLPPSSLKSVLRSLPGRGGLVRLRPLTPPADLRRADLGRSARHPNLRLRELLGAVDGECCRFPAARADGGCTPTTSSSVPRAGRRTSTTSQVAKQPPYLSPATTASSRM